MKNLWSLNKYMVKYKWYLLSGLLFVTVSNLFAVMPPRLVRQVLDKMQAAINSFHQLQASPAKEAMKDQIFTLVFQSGMWLLGMALLRGVFMFLMRQTIIVMSRHIEYDQKNEIYAHYQQLHTGFFKANFTGDLMNRISEDVSRVRMYTGPAIMYFVNMLVLTGMSVYGMVSVNLKLTIWVVAPLPLLAASIYIINKIIFNKSTKIQAQLSQLTTTAQESYSGIRVIKSYVQERNMMRFFEQTSSGYKDSAINLSLTEAIYFPAMSFFIGLSMLSTILVGGYFAINGEITTGNIAEFVLYINLLMFPISSIGMVASMTQRAGASQKRIDEFLQTAPQIVSEANAVTQPIAGDIKFNNVSFTYPHTGIQALKDFNLHIKPRQKVAIIGKTGSGKSTIAHLLLRMYDPQNGEVLFDDKNARHYDVQNLRAQIGLAPQEAYLFSDTILNNIKFGKANATQQEVEEAARMADLENDIVAMPLQYETVIGERGVMLSGGQKQRMTLARALVKQSPVLLLDECLSAVDTQTEKTILANLKDYLNDKTLIVITHRIFTSWTFDKIIVLDDGTIVEAGTHDELLALNGRYAKLYAHQIG
jgi:ATP-binding cassette, subfamily B, multidrug efflux pump